jgi:hypothetical protein
MNPGFTPTRQCAASNAIAQGLIVAVAARTFSRLSQSVAASFGGIRCVLLDILSRLISPQTALTICVIDFP